MRGSWDREEEWERWIWERSGGREVVWGGGGGTEVVRRIRKTCSQNAETELNFGNSVLRTSMKAYL